MKIQCDVCTAAEASVFCCADEAALCTPCDRRIHRANKLASKHRRFSLQHPPSRPSCDICQDRPGFLFCREDRAILCRDCDDSVHSATPLAAKHSRFLLTGATLSPAPMPDETNGEVLSTSASAAVVVAASENSSSSSSSSSISEYLIKTLPGWHVEDFLTDDSSAAIANGFFQFDEAVPVLEAEEFALWGGHVAAVPATAAKEGSMMNGGGQSGGRGGGRRRGEDVYIVPQFGSDCGGGNKKSRLSF